MSVSRDISLAALTVLALSPPEAIAAAARCGYSHVGLRPIAATSTEPHFPMVSDAGLRRAISAALGDHGIGVLDIEIFRLRPGTVVTEFEAALVFGAEVGARFALVAGNDPDLVRTADNLAALRELASHYGILPHLEFMPWTCVPDLSTALAVADRTGSGILVDAFHLDRSGGSPLDIPRNDPRFGYVQLCDTAGPIPADMEEILREAREDRRYPGEGDCDLAGLLRRLSPGVPVSLEVPVKTSGLTLQAHAQRAYESARHMLDAAMSSEPTW